MKSITATTSQPVLQETLTLPTSGQEVFSENILHEGHFYELVISGIIETRYYRFFSFDRLDAWDAFHKTDYQGNFLTPLDIGSCPHIFCAGLGDIREFADACLDRQAFRSHHTYRLVFETKTSRRFAANIRRGISKRAPRIGELYGGFEIKIIDRVDLFEAQEARRKQQMKQAERESREAEARRVADDRARQIKEEEAIRLRREQDAAKQRQKEKEIEVEKKRQEAEALAQIASAAEAKAREREAERQRAELDARTARLRIHEERERLAHALQIQQDNEWRNKVQKQNDRFRLLNEAVLMYKDFVHYQDEAWIEAFARKHLDELIENRAEILKNLLGFHHDKAFIDLLKTRNPEIYQRAIWRSKALAKAEQFEVQPKTGRRKTTPEEYRERRARWLKLKADDAIALQQARHGAVQEHREFLDQCDLTDEERHEYESEFLDELYKANGTADHSTKGTTEYETVS